VRGHVEKKISKIDGTIGSGGVMGLRLNRINTMLLIFLLFSLGCQTAYYSVWEKLGKEKRHLLRDQVQKAQADQEEAADQFKDVLTRIKELYGFEGGDLEKAYNKLKADYEESEARADAVKERVKKVETIAQDLFREWEKELKEISDRGLRSKSAQSLKITKEHYAQLHEAMKKAESSMGPVLDRLKDYVLFLKHNLNAQAIGALKNEVGQIEVDVNDLVRDMGKSIEEADRFLKALQ
jgi:F0F1-type ATP synthase membrane subunit b/b'